MAAIRSGFIYNYFGQIPRTHTPKHKTHTRPCSINTKRKKIKKVKDVKVKKKKQKKQEARGIMVLKYLTFFSSFQEELA